MKFGLIGKTLKHSYSKKIHEMFGKYEYDLISIEKNELSAFLENSEYSGFNVTIPYKKTIIPFCAEISPAAKKIGSVNTVVKRNGRLLGYNTDYAGFSAAAKKAGISFYNKKVAILGSGGTYNTAKAVICDEGAREIVSVSRSGEYNYDNQNEWNDCEIVVNTTPVGMYPDNGSAIVNINDFKSCEGVIDVVYNPLKTRLVFDAECRGIAATGGLYMLVFQAKEAFEIFTGEKISDERTEEIYEKLLSGIENIVFIGMPGSGKSTAGGLASEYLSRELLDTDKLVEKQTGYSIPEIFNRFGEDYFRSIETGCLKETGKENGKIISCGGGVVKKRENLYHLAQNGRIYWIKRDISDLETDGRPLSASVEALKKMERERTPLYESFADVTIENNGSLSELLELLKNKFTKK